LPLEIWPRQERAFGLLNKAYSRRPGLKRTAISKRAYSQRRRKECCSDWSGDSRPFCSLVLALAFSFNRITTAEFIARDFVLMKSSTKDKIKGGFKEAKGKAKEKAGEATRNPDLRDRGTAEKVGGKVRRKIGDVKKVFEQ
jgi:uncharacterized protein YjbJ (UPF0337 family)